MLLERAATLFQSQGFAVKVRPCVIGQSGAIHSPDIVVSREGEPERAVFVLDAVDGHMPIEHRRGMAQDMGCEAVFVIGRPSPEALAYIERHKLGFVGGEELGETPAPAPVPAAPKLGDSDEDIRAVSPRRGAVERPLTAFHSPSDGLPVDEHESSGAVLLPSNPRPDAPKPRAPRVGRGVVQFPAQVPEDGDAVLIVSEPREPARPAIQPPPPAQQAGRWEEALAAQDDGESGAELLPSMPTARRVPHEADRMAKHDPSIWNPTARLQMVKQAAKANGFETTAPQDLPAPASPPPPPAAPSFSSAWLNQLKK